MDNQEPPTSSGASENDSNGTSPLVQRLREQVWTITALIVCGGFAVYLSSGMMTNDTGAIKTSSTRKANTPEAIEKLVRSAFPSAEGFAHVQIEPTDSDGGTMNLPKYPYHSINVSYHARTVLSTASTFSDIQRAMKDAYTEILGHTELHVSAIDITAQLEMQDSFGHDHGWIDVYQTRLGPQVMPRINRKNLRAVNFQEIWDVTFTHGAFRALDKQ